MPCHIIIFLHVTCIIVTLLCTVTVISSANSHSSQWKDLIDVDKVLAMSVVADWLNFGFNVSKCMHTL